MKQRSFGRGINRDIYSYSRILALISGAALLCLATGHAYADGCTVANVAGRFGGIAFGTDLSGNALGLPAGPAATAGTALFDGQGNYSFVASASFNGVIQVNATGQGTYTVNSDCTGILVVGPYTSNIVFVNNRNDIFGVHTVPGVVANLIFKRISTQ